MGTMRVLESTADVMEELGGLQAVADLFGVTYKAAHNWKATGKFPAKTYDAIEEKLHAAGCTAPRALWAWSDAAVAVAP